MKKFLDKKSYYLAIQPQEVKKDFYQLKTANHDIASSTREVIASRESLRLARLRFNAGITTQREVINNQRDLTQAEVGYSEAITAYNTSIARLGRRTGIDHVKACNYPNVISNNKGEEVGDDIPKEAFPLIKPCPRSPLRNRR